MRFPQVDYTGEYEAQRWMDFVFCAVGRIAGLWKAWHSMGASMPALQLLLCGEHQPLPPPDDFAFFLAEAEEASRFGWGVANQFENFFAILGCGAGGIEVPVQIGLLEWLKLGEHYAQSGIFAESRPCFLAQEAMVTGVAKFLHGVNPLLGRWLVVLDRAIDQEECAIGFEDAGGFPHERRRIAKVVRGYTARHEVERVVRIWKRFGGVLARLDLQSPLAGSGRRAFEHRGGNIGQRTLPTDARQAKSRVSRSRGDIQRASGFQPRQPPQRFLNIGHIRQNVPLAVPVALAVKLLLGRTLDWVHII